MTSNRVRARQERLRSNAPGPMGHRPTRAQQLAEALADWADEQITASARHLIHTTQTQPEE